MTFSLFATGLFAAIGIYLILCDLLHMPTIQATKAALKLTQGQKVHGYHAVVLQLTDGLSKHIHMDSYRRRNLAATLKYAGIEQSPETYLSGIIVKSASRLILAVPCIWVAPIVIPIIILWTITGFLDKTKAAEKVVAEKRAGIEHELPRFVATIAQEIGASRDVLSLLEGYRASAGDVFRNEIEITIAGMKSGSQEQALNRLSGRVGSGMLSEVVRGLLGVLRGDDGVIFFQLLNHDYKKGEIQALEKEAQKRPGQMKKYSYLMMACFMAIYLYVIIKQMFGGIGGLF